VFSGIHNQGIMSSFNDMCKNQLEVTKDYILYRNRLLDTKTISTFRTKGKRLLINSYKQNSGEPTMLIMFSSKDDAQRAFDGLKAILYPQGSAPASEDNMGLAGALLGIALCGFLTILVRVL
jgi:hypothetical protein